MAFLLNGHSIPGIIYGTTLKTPGLLDSALRVGFRAFDSAGTRKFHREDIDGSDFRSVIGDHDTKLSRDDILIQTKFCPAGSGQADPVPFDSSDSLGTQVLKSMKRSLEDLQIDVVDVYFMHRPMYDIEETLAVWRMMEHLVSRGVVRYLGVCNVDYPTLSTIFERATIKPAFVQNRFKRSNGYDRRVKKFCTENRISYQVFGVLSAQNADLLSLPVVKEMARKEDISVQQALRLLVLASGKTSGLEMCLLTHTAKMEHMKNSLFLAARSGEVDGETIVAFDRALTVLVEGGY
ncbi:hypothetical protein GP486_001610 [Trichoglossum hirsutum]|uniref:NADP-dependent oxidoreductase domain-containing protein n=1 Tax=Trichoglossum hirsutum TaxID=265104 RepID=A0A9P8LGK8_9PEZI|nr:hypothetical protein GP486_001610 [Trichoglossum hirsutum]